MSSLFSSVAQQLDKTELSQELQAAGVELAAFVEGDAYVGEVYSVGYDEALVQIHDYNRQQVGGIPALSFLIATRIIPGTIPDVRKEDASIVLLRVLDHADLPNSQEALRVRVENAQRVSGELDKTFRSSGRYGPHDEQPPWIRGRAVQSHWHFLFGQASVRREIELRDCIRFRP